MNEGQGEINNFNGFICSGIERIDGRVYGYVFSIIIIISEARSQMGSCMERDRQA